MSHGERSNSCMGTATGDSASRATIKKGKSHFAQPYRGRPKNANYPDLSGPTGSDAYTNKSLEQISVQC
jgi:hypothetical protein